MMIIAGYTTSTLLAVFRSNQLILIALITVPTLDIDLMLLIQSDFNLATLTGW